MTNSRDPERAFRLNTRPLIVGGVLMGLGGVLGLAGIVVSGSCHRRGGAGLGEPPGGSAQPNWPGTTGPGPRPRPPPGRPPHGGTAPRSTPHRWPEHGPLITGHSPGSLTGTRGQSGTLDLARWQFALTSVNQLFFVPVTSGLAFLAALLQSTSEPQRLG